MTTFRENKLEVLRGAVPPLMIDVMQRVTRVVLSSYAAQPPAHFHADYQVPLRHQIGRLPIYDAVMTSLLPLIQEKAGMELLPSYSFPVINFPGAELVRHTDRPACEVTATLTVLNEPDTMWPIYVEENGVAHRIDLNPGDLALYDGQNYPHWREPQAAGHFNVSVFYHYVAVGGPFEMWHDREMSQHLGLRLLYDPPTLRSIFPHA